MRIGITGVPGSGKTALAARLAELTGLPLIKNQARNVGRVYNVDPFSIRSDPPQMIEFQKYVLTSQMAEEDMHAEARGGFVTDTTAVDCLAHWEVYCRGAADERAGELYRQICLSRKYDALFYLPPPSCGADLELDRAIRGLLEGLGLSYRTLSRTGLAEQVKASLAWLKPVSGRAAK